MKVRKLLKKVAKKDGKCSIASQTIVKLKNSREFSYLIDPARA